MQIKVIHVVLFINYLYELASVIVKLKRMKSGDIEVVYLKIKQLDVMILVFRTHYRKKFQIAISKRKLAFNFP